MPVRRWSSFSSQRIRSRSFASRFDRGSSRSRICGSTTRLRASATRCCWPPRQLAREAPLEPGEVDQLEHARDARPDVRPRHPPDLQTEGDVLVHRLVRPDRVVLEHHAHPAPLRRDDGRPSRRRSGRPPGWLPASGVRKPGDEPEERGLAAAARAEQRHELAVADLEAQVAHGRHARRTASITPLDRDAGHASAPSRISAPRPRRSRRAPARPSRVGERRSRRR